MLLLATRGTLRGLRDIGRPEATLVPALELCGPTGRERSGAEREGLVQPGRTKEVAVTSASKAAPSMTRLRASGTWNNHWRARRAPTHPVAQPSGPKLARAVPVRVMSHIPSLSQNSRSTQPNARAAAKQHQAANRKNLGIPIARSDTARSRKLIGSAPA